MPHRATPHESGPHKSAPNTSSKGTPPDTTAALNRRIYDDRDHDYVLSYDLRSNARHQRSEDEDYANTLDQDRRHNKPDN